MPAPDVARKQHALGAVAGLALLAFALAYRFFPGLLRLDASSEPSVMSAVATSPPPTWSAVSGATGGDALAAAAVPQPAGTSMIDAVRMGPPVAVSESVAQLLARAEAAEAAGTILEPTKDSAVALYREALNLAPRNPQAEAALERIGAGLRDAALAAIERGDEGGAERNLAAWSQLPHAESELADVRARVETLRRVLPMLTQAATLARSGHATSGPKGGTALDVYRKVLELDPENHLADAGLASIERSFLDRALAAAAQDDFEGADEILGEAVNVRPGSPQALLEARGRIEQLRSQRAESVLAQARSALDAGNADLAEQLATRAQAISPDLAGLDDFNQGLRNARLYGSLSPGQTLRDRFLDISGSAPPIVVIPTGTFDMGSADGEQGRSDSEGPQRAVAIKFGFALGQAEVSVGEFREFIGSSGYRTDAERLGASAVYDERSGQMVERHGMTWRNDYAGALASAELPVVNVSWNDATAYLAWLSAHTGKRYRLPSEAEFEYALRAGGETRYPWGSGSPESVVGNFTGDGDRSPSKRSWSVTFPSYSDGFWGPAPIGSFPANAFGLRDMEGNVSEWVEDCWHDNYVRAPRDSTAWVNPGCSLRVVRGGSWGSDHDQVRSAYRVPARADTRSARVGFRIARDL